MHLHSGEAPAIPVRGLRSATDAHIDAQHAAFGGAELDDVTPGDLIDLVQRVGPVIGLTLAARTYLEQLIRLTRAGDWRDGGRPVIWRSLDHAARDNHCAIKTVQRWEHQLMVHGLLTWHDSGSRKRYGRRRKDGTIEYAFGPDLTPLAQRHDELCERLAEHEAQIDAWNAAWRCIVEARGRVRNLRNRLGMTPDPELAGKVGIEVPIGALEHMHAELEIEYDRLVAEIEAKRQDGAGAEPEPPATAVAEAAETEPAAPAETGCQEAGGADSEAGETAPEKPAETGEMSRADDVYVTHIYPTNHLPRLTSNTTYPAEAGPPSAAPSPPEQARKGGGVRRPEIAPDTGIQHVDPAHVACIATPGLRHWLPDDRPVDWDDLIEAARVVAHEIGTSGWAWNQGVRRIGVSATALCVLLAYIRSHDPSPGRRVRQPGGYLTGCVRKAETGDLHLHASVFALLRRSALQ